MSLSLSTYPDKIHEEAQHTIGEEHHDNDGDLFSYVEFPAGTYRKGIILRDAKSADLISTSGVGTLTAAAPVGSTTLQDNGEFANKDLRGAIGSIFEGAGIGQSFFVKSVAKDGNSIEIQLLKRSGEGWETALNTTSKYRLFLPGRVYIAPSTSTNKIRGVQIYDNFTVPTGEFRYGFVRKTGIDDGLIDASGSVAGNGLVTCTTGGLIVGTTSALAGIGEAANGDISGNVDTLMPIEFMIFNTRRSLRRPRRREDPVISVK